ncbi:MAG: gamma-glutamylcyclotransferase family protein [Nitrosopumilus sp.]
MIKLFTYGTLMNPEMMSMVIRREITGVPYVANFKHLTPLMQNPMYMQMGHSLDEEDTVEGIVYEITSDEWRLVDKYETDMYLRDFFVRDGECYWFYTENFHF